MNWFLIALIPPALWSITNHIDKYLISKYFKGAGVGAMMIFSSIIGILLVVLIGIFHPQVFSFELTRGLLISLNGILYLIAVLPYFYALKEDEASITVALFQLIPIFGVVLAWIVLGETLTARQALGGAVVIAGAIGISLDMSEARKARLKTRVFLLMALSSLLFALNFMFFKYFALEADFWTVGFYEYLGFIGFAVFLVTLVKSYREEFLSVIKVNSATVLTINGANEIINIIAKLSFNYASLLTPIAFTWIVGAFQPFFVIIYGIILTIFFPHISVENIERKQLAQKFLMLLVMLVGGYIVNS